jgi:hypothetical protein
MENLQQPTLATQAETMALALALLTARFKPDEIFEVRTRTGKRVQSGYYDRDHKADAIKHAIAAPAAATYVTLNPVRADIDRDQHVKAVAAVANNDRRLRPANSDQKVADLVRLEPRRFVLSVRTGDARRTRRIEIDEQPHAPDNIRVLDPDTAPVHTEMTIELGGTPLKECASERSRCAQRSEEFPSCCAR